MEAGDTEREGETSIFVEEEQSTTLRGREMIEARIEALN